MTNYGYHLQATYESGYVLTEDEFDHSPYDAGMNVFNAILNKRPESVHGKLVRLALMPNETGNGYLIDWTQLPDNARPIRFVDHEQDTVGGIVTDNRIVGLRFGYQYTDETGANVQKIEAVI